MNLPVLPLFMLILKSRTHACTSIGEYAANKRETQHIDNIIIMYTVCCQRTKGNSYVPCVFLSVFKQFVAGEINSPRCFKSRDAIRCVDQKVLIRWKRFVLIHLWFKHGMNIRTARHYDFLSKAFTLGISIRIDCKTQNHLKPSEMN